MKRDIIKMEENTIRVTGCDVWMSEPELVELFGTTAGAVGSGIKSVLKEEALNAYEVCKCVRLTSGNNADVYNMEVVIALAFRLDTYPAALLRMWLVRKATMPVRATPPIIIRYEGGSLNGKNGGQAFGLVRRSFSGNGLAVIIREELFDVRFPIEDFPSEQDKGYLSSGTVFLQGAAAYFQQGDHLLVRKVSFSRERRMIILRQPLRIFHSPFQGLQHRGDTPVVCRNHSVVIHISVDSVGSYCFQVSSRS